MMSINNGHTASGFAAQLERAERVRDVLTAGERLLCDLEELGLSLAAAHLAMSLDMVVIEDRGRSSTQ
jgi:hypothetical protein